MSVSNYLFGKKNIFCVVIKDIPKTVVPLVYFKDNDTDFQVNKPNSDPVHLFEDLPTHKIVGTGTLVRLNGLNHIIICNHIIKETKSNVGILFRTEIDQPGWFVGSGYSVYMIKEHLDEMGLK